MDKNSKQGSKRKYDTPEKFKAAIQAYFDDPETITIKYKHDEYLEQPLMTFDAIARGIGLASRQSLYDYRRRGSRKEEYGEVVAWMQGKLKDYWTAQGQNGNATFAQWFLSLLNRENEKVSFEDCGTELEKARKLIDSASEGDISLDTMSKLMSAIKTTSDINKIDEIERKVNELLKIAGVE